ncbi:hypothetical protein GMORB2_7230, partial [Geosmithia morbida]
GVLTRIDIQRLNESDSHDLLSPRSDTSSAIIHQGSESHHRQLREIVNRLRSGPSGPKDVDAAYELYGKHKERANTLCHAILHEELAPPARQASSPHQLVDPLLRRGSSLESPNGLYDQRSSFSNRSLTEVATAVTSARGRRVHHNEPWLSAMREWKLHIEHLVEWFRTSLSETYRKFEQDATLEMVEALFNSRRFRREAVHRMRNASVTRVISADPQFFPRYEIRFRNYEKAKQELVDIRSLVQSAEAGISPERKIEETDIAPHGDSILEFANHQHDAGTNEPVLRFRVSSHTLAETSPIFARMFSSTNPEYLYVHDDDDVNVHLPPPPTRYTCRDGSEAKVYRMPQLELNHLRSFEILLYAAHMQTEKVPRDISFEQFVAISECSIRYKCTLPLERIVETEWLPHWMCNGADDMADGMVAISFAFGLRTLFSRMTKSAILNLVDEADLQRKPWPQAIKNKIWAVRCAKMAQVYMCCISAIQEYLPLPSRNPADEVQPIAPSDLRGNNRAINALVTPSIPLPSTLSTTPRCPKGSHWCDAGNLGWMMLIYNELNLLSQVLRQNVLTHHPDTDRQPSRSLAQLVEALRRIPSPLSPIHRGGVCDPGPAFRLAINDIYNSVSGLTLHDVSGKSHGWALSKHLAAEPQDLGPERMAVNDRKHHGVATEFPEHIRLQILGCIDDFNDLRSAAVINRVWYGTYKTHELYLMRNILRAGRIRLSSTELPHHPIVPRSTSNAEEKVLKIESEQIKSRITRSADGDFVSLGEDEDDDDDDSDDESEFEDDGSVDGTPAPSITESIWREIRLRSVSSRKFTDAAAAAATSYSASPRRPQPVPFSNATDAILDSSDSTPRQNTLLPRSDSTSLSDDDRDKTQSAVVHDKYTDEPPLTDEEARRILWPDAPDTEEDAMQRLSCDRIHPVEGLREKFLVGDKSFIEVLDTASGFTEDKKLLTEREWAMRTKK